MRYINKSISLLLILICLVHCKCKDDNDPVDEPTSSSGTVTFNISNVIDAQPIELGSENKYLINDKDTLSIEGLKYIVSNIEFLNNGESKYTESGSYHLVNASDVSTTMISLKKVPVGTYDEVRISIGVDPDHDNGTSIEGDLSTGNGLFWISWESYIYFRLDGYYYNNTRSTVTHHIGGEAAYSPYSLTGFTNAIEVAANKTTGVTLDFNIESLYNSPNQIDLSVEHQQIVASTGGMMDTLSANLNVGIITVNSIGNPE